MDEERGSEHDGALTVEADALWRRPPAGQVEQRYTSVEPDDDAPAVAFGPAGGPPDDGHRSSWRRKLAAVCGVTAVLGLLVGWAVRRDGDEPVLVDAATTSVNTTAAPTTISATATQLTKPTEPTLVVLPSSPPSTGNETRPAGWRFSTTSIDPLLSDLGIRIVAVLPGELMEIDTGSGLVATATMRRDFEELPTVDAGKNWIVVRHADTQQTELFRRQDASVEIDLGQVAIREPGTDSFWKFDVPATEPLAVDDPAPRAPQPQQVMEVDHEGIPTGTSLGISSLHTVLGADPAGGIVVAAPGGTYHLDSGGSVRVTTGELIALSASAALAVDCNNALTASCELFVIDRATGTAEPLTPVLPDSLTGAGSGFAFFNPAAYGSNRELMPISPDGRYAPIAVVGPQRSFGVIDLTSGEYTELNSVPESSLWWSPDSRAVLYLRQRRLVLYNFDAGTRTNVVPDIDAVSSFTVRT